MEFDAGPVPIDVEPAARALATSLEGLSDVRCEGLVVEVFDPSAGERLVRYAKALTDAGRKELIGKLIPKTPPKAALDARRKEATYVHADDAGVSRSVGYRPGRRGARRL